MKRLKDFVLETIYIYGLRAKGNSRTMSMAAPAKSSATETVASFFSLNSLTHSVLTLTVLWREVKAASWRQLDLQPKSLPLFTSHSRRPRGKSPLHPGLSPSIHQVRVELSHTDKKGRLSSLVIIIAVVLLLKLINTGRKLYISNYRPNEELFGLLAKFSANKDRRTDTSPWNCFVRNLLASYCMYKEFTFVTGKLKT